MNRRDFVGSAWFIRLFVYAIFPSVPVNEDRMLSLTYFRIPAKRFRAAESPPELCLA
uniref:Uncharacterized protein n=1 Tax=Candidatus Kentrum sp. TUN TaxID=2126343 RepID=A0A451AK63_9GAMM|nr:MAG: hypothetical protein BECKTUN1418D_GA0071000_14981 [Candidatus Kentron sp. TUN]